MSSQPNMDPIIIFSVTEMITMTLEQMILSITNIAEFAVLFCSGEIMTTFARDVLTKSSN